MASKGIPLIRSSITPALWSSQRKKTLTCKTAQSWRKWAAAISLITRPAPLFRAPQTYPVMAQPPVPTRLLKAILRSCTIDGRGLIWWPFHSSTTKISLSKATLGFPALIKSRAPLTTCTSTTLNLLTPVTKESEISRMPSPWTII